MATTAMGTMGMATTAMGIMVIATMEDMDITVVITADIIVAGTEAITEAITVAMEEASITFAILAVADFLPAPT